MRLTQVFLAELVDLDANFFNYRFPMTTEDLHDAIGERGLLEPLVIREKTPAEPAILVCGHRRFWELKAQTYEKPISVMWLDPTQTTLEACLWRSLADNGVKHLNLIERSRILDIGVRRLELSLKTVMLALGLHPSQELAEDYLSLLALTERECDIFMLGKFNLKVLSRYARLARTDRQVFFPLIDSLDMGQNRVDECLINLEAYARRQKTTIAAVIEAICQESQPTTADEFRRATHVLAHPLLFELEVAFAREMKNLDLPSSITVKPPAFFEGDRYDLTLQFRNADELKKFAKKLLEAADKPAFENLTKLL